MSDEDRAKRERYEKYVSIIKEVLVSRGMKEDEAQKAAEEVEARASCTIYGGLPIN